MFIFFGLVAVIGTAYLQAGTVQPVFVAAAVPVGALTTAILVVNNLRDIPTDAAAGKRTLAVVMGADKTQDRICGCWSSLRSPCRSRSSVLGGWSALVLAPLLAVPLVAAAVADGPKVRRAARAQRCAQGHGAAGPGGRGAVRCGAGGRAARVTVIASIHTDKVSVPFLRPFATSTGMWFAREAWIVRLVDADGRTGLGEAVLEPADGQTASTVLDHLTEDLTAGALRDWARTAAALELHGSPGRALRAAIDTAWLDLGGVAGGGAPFRDPGPAASLSDGAAAASARVPAPSSAPGPAVGVNATLPSIGPEASAEAARQAVSAGFTTLKLKGGAERETDALVARLRAVRAAVGPDVRLRLDVNGAWDLETATDRIDAIARFGLEYVEQPLAGDDTAALAELRRRVSVPLAADETVTSVRAVRGLLDAGAVDVLVVKPVRVGGPVVAAEIADLAAGRGVRVVVSTLFETGIGIASGLAVAAALPAVPGGRLDHGLATAGLLEDDLLADGLLLDAGRLRAPGGPGAGRLGIRIDERALARYGANRAARPTWEAWDA